MYLLVDYFEGPAADCSVSGSLAATLVVQAKWKLQLNHDHDISWRGLDESYHLDEMKKIDVNINRVWCWDDLISLFQDFLWIQFVWQWFISLGEQHS